MFDGAKQFGAVTEAPAQLTVAKLTPCDHVLSMLGTDAEGTVPTSNPVMVIVRVPMATDKKLGKTAAAGARIT